MLRKSREEILKDFKAQVAQGKILVGVEEVLYQEFFLTVMPMPSFRKWDRKYFLS